MRSGFVPLLTAWLFLLHVVTECGSHHGHASEAIVSAASCCPGAGASSANCPSNCGHSHGQGHNTCHGSHCVFVRGKSRTDPARNRQETNRLTSTKQADVGSPASSRRQESGFAVASVEPVRRHLMLQVLLV